MPSRRNAALALGLFARWIVAFLFMHQRPAQRRIGGHRMPRSFDSPGSVVFTIATRGAKRRDQRDPAFGRRSDRRPRIENGQAARPEEFQSAGRICCSLVRVRRPSARGTRGDSRPTSAQRDVMWLNADEGQPCGSQARSDTALHSGDVRVSRAGHRAGLLHRP